MHYLSLLPSLIALVVLSIIDLHTRTVPRYIVVSGLVTQFLVFVFLGPLPSSIFTAVWALLLAIISGALQILACLAIPGALGLGDATASVLAVFSVTFFMGLTGLALWWFFLGLLGSIALIILRMASAHTRKAKASMAFVPVIAGATLVTHAVGIF